MLYLKLGNWGFLSNLNNLFYVLIYAQEKGLPLLVDDSETCLGRNYPFLQSLLNLPPFVRRGSTPYSANSFHQDFILRFCRSLSRDYFRKRFRALYCLTPSYTKLLNNYLQRKKLTQSFQIGV